MTKTPLGDFKITNESTNQQSNNYKYKEFYQLSWLIPKYQPIVEPLLQYPIGLDFVVTFFPLMHRPPIYDLLMQHGCVEVESVTRNYYNSSTKPKFYKNTRLAGKTIEKTSLTNFY